MKINKISFLILLFVFTEQTIGQFALQSNLDLNCSPQDAQMTNDGKNIYIAGLNENWGLCWLSRDSISGLLSYKGMVTSNTIKDFCNINQLMISPDDKYIYVSTYYSNSLVWFSREQNDGTPIYKGTLHQDSNSVRGLNTPFRIISNKAGTAIYVASDDSTTIALFTRDTITGEPSYTSIVQRYVRNQNNNFTAPRDLAITPDENFLYATYNDSCIVWYKRDLISGRLSFGGRYCWNDYNTITLTEPDYIRFSSDGTLLLIGSYANGSIASFHRDLNTGNLVFMKEVQNSNALYYLHDIDICHNEKDILTTSEKGVALFSLNKQNGDISFVKMLTNGNFWGTRLLQNKSENQFYVTRFYPGDIVTFNWDVSSVDKRNILIKNLYRRNAKVRNINLKGQKLKDRYTNQIFLKQGKEYIQIE